MISKYQQYVLVSTQSTRVSDGTTDGQTDGQNYDPQDGASIFASRGKNDYKQ